MNRIALPATLKSHPSVHSESTLSFDVATLDRRSSPVEEAAPFATFAPQHYEAGYAYPLVVWLHGAGGNEQQLRRVMPLVSMRNYVAVAPRGTWAEADRLESFSWRQKSDDIEETQSRIFDCIDAASERFNIHQDRIFLAGYGNGGTMALRVAWNHPGRFAGVATIGGELPSQFCPFRCVKELRQLPCLLAMARQSEDYPEVDVCRDLRLLHSAGCTVALRQYPGGDDLTTNMLSDLDAWMMELVCSAGSRSTGI